MISFNAQITKLTHFICFQEYEVQKHTDFGPYKPRILNAYVQINS